MYRAKGKTYTDDLQLQNLPVLSHSSGNASLGTDDLHLLRRKLAETIRLKRNLRAEAAQNEAIIKQLKRLVNGDETEKPQISSIDNTANEQPDFSFLTSTTLAKSFKLSTATSSEQPLTTNTKFVLSQLPALRSLLAELRPKVPNIRNAHPGIESAADERREDRRWYIEQRVKLHVDRGGDVGMGEAGVLGGKKTDAEEIMALEKVAGHFESQS